MKSTRFFSVLCLVVAFALVSKPNFANNAEPVGPIIDQFLAMLNGTEAAAQAAVNKFGTAEVIANKMIPFGKNPKIVSKDGDCVVVALDYDGEKNEYTLCEKDGKINVFELYFGEDEE